MNFLPRTLQATAMIAVGAAFAAPSVSVAADFPTAPLRIVLTLPPGGALDLLARTLSEPLGQALGQPVLVDNRPGAGGNVAAMAVAKAPADGHTMLFTTDSLVINPLIYREVGYEANDFIPVVGVGKGPQVISASGAAPYRTLDDLITAAKQAPGTIAYGSAGSGQASHFAGEQLKRLAGIDLMHVPYRGSGPAINDAIGGQIPVVISSLAAAKPHYGSERLRPLAVTSRERVAFAPEVPTVAELGVPGYASENWSGIFVPAGTPEAAVVKLNQHIAEIVTSASFQELLRQQGFDVEGITQLDDFQNLVAESAQSYDEQVKALSLVID
ncbi:MAG: Bug family tripartite tricarboxylate transporter substrate binding protein [Pigmentiphaga sp.]